MTLSCISEAYSQLSTYLSHLFIPALVIPAAYATTITGTIPCKTSDSEECLSPGLLAISRGTAVLLLMVYCAYLFFQVDVL